MYQVGEIVYATISHITNYGAFVKLDDDYTGLIHISEFSDGYVKDIRDFVSINEKVKLKVIEVEEDNKRLKLSYKALNKTRGIKGEIPHYSIGFKSLRDRLPQFISEQKSLNNNKEDDEA